MGKRVATINERGERQEWEECSIEEWDKLGDSEREITCKRDEDGKMIGVRFVRLVLGGVGGE